MTTPSPPSPLKTLTNIAINVLHVFLSIINHLAFTIQIKSLDMSTFFLPYFLSPKPAGIRAANLEQGGEVVFQTLVHWDTHLLQKGFSVGGRISVTAFFVFFRTFSRFSWQSCGGCKSMNLV